MAFVLKRQISDEEKELILNKYGRVCFATGHPISDEENVHFDHIKAFSDGGQSEIDNIAPMCEAHNKQKGRLPLYDFKIKLMIEEFFEDEDDLTLNDELEYLKRRSLIERYGEKICIMSKREGQLTIEIENKQYQYMLYKCPTTNWEYFYANLPVVVLDSDDDVDNEIGLQPRYLIKKKVFNMFRHFERHPVLQPSICRISKNRILVFDGQHKIASLLWGNRRNFECKVYLDPDTKLLNKTNISAHDEFAQTRFYSSIMVAKLGAQFGSEFEEYKNLEDDGIKTEKGFMDYLQSKEKLSTGELNKRFRSFLFNSILEDKNNKITQYISKGNRSSAEKPITMDMLEKSLFSKFLYRHPLEVDMTTDHYKRGVEFTNIIEVMNMLYDEALSLWDSRSSESNPTQLKLNRIFRSKSIMAWSELIHDAVCAKLNIIDSDEKVLSMYRKFTKDDFSNIRLVIRRLAEWNMWASPSNSEIDRILSDNKSAVKNWLKQKGLTTGYLMGAPE